MSRLLPLSRRAVRGCVGSLWLIDAALQGQPHLFTRDWLSSDLAQSVMGQPPEINHSIYSVINLMLPAAAAWNAVFVLIQAPLGLGLTFGRFEWPAIVASLGVVARGVVGRRGAWGAADVFRLARHAWPNP